MAWNDIGNENNKSEGASKFENAFLKLGSGKNRIRVVQGEPFSRWVHWIPQANGGKGLSVNCPGKGCPICKDIAENRKNKTKSKYSARKSHAINVINKKDGEPKEIKILDKGNGVFSKLKVLMDNMGDLQTYDVDIIMTGKDFSDIEYNVLPVFPQTELTGEEKDLSTNLYDLKEAFPMYSISEVEMFMNGATVEEVFKLREENTQGKEEAIENTMPNVNFNKKL